MANKIQNIKKQAAQFLIAFVFLHFFLCLFFSANCQNSDNLSLIKSFNISAKYLQTDELGNIYLVTPTNQLYKYSKDGNLLSTLNYSYNGNISSIDVTNPMELYIFYKEMNSVIFLDNNLAFRGELKLNNFQIVQAAAIARSYDNGLWVFDLADLQLKKFDKDGNLQQSSGNIRQYISGITQPTFLFDNTEKVFVNDTSNGILLFDVFASFIKTVPIKNKSTIQIKGNEIFYADSNQLKVIDVKFYQKKTVFSSIELLDASWFGINNERFYLYKNGNLSIFKY